ncbi:IS1 family transposase [Legionella longbeachae]
MKLNEPWAFLCDKSNQRWLSPALNHYTSKILAYTFGDRSDRACK